MEGLEVCPSKDRAWWKISELKLFHTKTYIVVWSAVCFRKAGWSLLWHKELAGSLASQADLALYQDAYCALQIHRAGWRGRHAVEKCGKSYLLPHPVNVERGEKNPHTFWDVFRKLTDEHVLEMLFCCSFLFFYPDKNVRKRAKTMLFNGGGSAVKWEHHICQLE